MVLLGLRFGCWPVVGTPGSVVINCWSMFVMFLGCRPVTGTPDSALINFGSRIVKLVACGRYSVEVVSTEVVTVCSRKSARRQGFSWEFESEQIACFAMEILEKRKVWNLHGDETKKKPTKTDVVSVKRKHAGHCCPFNGYTHCTCSLYVKRKPGRTPKT